jgi:molybdopterin converting factor small subunit
MKMSKTNNKISITVKFFADFRKFGPDKAIITIPKGSRIQDIIEKYKIPETNSNKIILVNGFPHKKPEYVVKDGDIIAIFPPIAGG